MKKPTDQADYWNSVANEKVLTHPVNISLLEKFVDHNSFIVDYGCGYGRVVEQLNNSGFHNIHGLDTAIELIHRGHKNGVKNIFHVNSPDDLPVENNSVDWILLSAVLTCIPDNQSQTELIEVLSAKLKQGGFIYISDYYLQNNSNERLFVFEW